MLRHHFHHLPHFLHLHATHTSTSVVLSNPRTACDADGEEANDGANDDEPDCGAFEFHRGERLHCENDEEENAREEGDDRENMQSPEGDETVIYAGGGHHGNHKGKKEENRRQSWTLLPYLQHSHHPVAQVLRDMAVEHPVAGIAYIEENIHGVTRTHESRVLPDEVLCFYSVIGEDKEPLSVKMNRVLHRVRGVRFIDDADFHLVSDFRRIDEFVVCGSRCLIHQFPLHHVAHRHRIHRTVFPLNAVRWHASHHHPSSHAAHLW